MPPVFPNYPKQMDSNRVLVGSPISNDWGTDVSAVLNFLQTGPSTVAALASGTPTVLNGSFELDTVGTKNPIGWINTNHSAQIADGSVISSDQYHGTNSYQINVQMGPNAGGTLKTDTTGGGVSGLLQCSEGLNYAIEFALKVSQAVTAAQLACNLTVNYYSSTGSSAGFTPDVFELNPNASASTPDLTTSWKYVRKIFVPPAGARYFTVAFDIGETAPNVPSITNVFLDGIFVFFPQRNARMSLIWPNASGQTRASFFVPPGVSLIKASLWGGSQRISSNDPQTITNNNNSVHTKRGYTFGYLPALKSGDEIVYGVGGGDGSDTFIRGPQPINASGDKFQWTAMGSAGTRTLGTTYGGDVFEIGQDKGANLMPFNQSGLLIFEW